MTAYHYTVKSSQYQRSIFTGFSQLQKDEEFVDLTLAADGCFVKVHKNIIALASPYLRDIIKSMSCEYPALFLNNVNAKVLGYMLEYIYQGEVDIPTESVGAFIQVCKSLHIVGIQDIPLKPLNDLNEQPTRNENLLERSTSTHAAHITINNGELEVEHYQNKNSIIENENNTNELKISELFSTTIQDNDQINHPGQKQHLADVEEMQTDTFAFNIQQNASNEDQQTNMHPDDFTNDDQQTNMLKITFTKEGQQTNMQPDISLNENQQPYMQQDISSNENQHASSKIQDISVIEIPSDIASHPVLTASTDTRDMIILPNNQYTSETSQSTFKCITVTPILDKDNTNSSDKTSVVITKDDEAKIVLEKPPPKDRIQITCDTLPMDVTKVPTIKDYLMDLKDLSTLVQYTTTQRGAVQVILNRYIYRCHHVTGSKGRWRCIDYRSSKCPAAVDIVDNAIVARKGVHSHPYHDNKIYKKHRKGLIFQSIQLAREASNEATRLSVVGPADSDVE